MNAKKNPAQKLSIKSIAWDTQPNYISRFRIIVFEKKVTHKTEKMYISFTFYMTTHEKILFLFFACVFFFLSISSIFQKPLKRDRTEMCRCVAIYILINTMTRSKKQKKKINYSHIFIRARERERKKETTFLFQIYICFRLYIINSHEQTIT